MRRATLAALALVPALALAQAYPNTDGFDASFFVGSEFPSAGRGAAMTPAVMTLPLTQVGAPYSSAYALLGRAWVEGGTRQTSGSLGLSWFGSGSAVSPSALPTTLSSGGWNAGNGVGASGLSIPASTRMICQLWTSSAWPTTLSSSPFAANIWDSTGSADQVTLPIGGAGGGASFDGAHTTTNLTVPGLNVVCFGCAAAGSTSYVKLNLGTTSSGSACAADWTDSLTYASSVVAASALSAGWTIIEAVVLDSAWSEATAVDIQRRWLGLYQGGNLLTVSRNSLRSVEINGFVSHVAAGVPAVAAAGLSTHPASTNYALYSGAMSSGSAGRTGWSLSGATLTTRTAEALDKTDSTRITSSSGSGGLVRTTATFGSSTGPFILSSYVKSDSTSDDVALYGTCTAGNASGATCLRSDGGACTASTSGASAWVDANVGASWVRLSLRYSCSSNNTTNSIILHPGIANSGTGTADFAMTQFEIRAYLSAYQRSESTASARAEDVIYGSVPAGVPTGSWSVTGYFTPADNVNWIGTPGSAAARVFWSVNTGGAANSARLDINSGNMGMQNWVYDASTYRTRLTTGIPSAFTGTTNTSTVHICSRYGTNIDNWTPVLNNSPYTGALTLGGAGTGRIATWPTGQPFFVGGSGASSGTGLWARDLRIYGREVCR